MTTGGRITHWAQPKTTLKTIGYAVENTTHANRYALAGLIATGAIALVFPILNNRLPKIVELAALVSAPICFGAGAVMAQSAIDPEKAHASLRLVQKDLFGKQIAIAAGVEQMRAKFAQVEEFHALIQNFPPEHQWYFIQQAGLESLYLEYVQALPEAQQGAIDVGATSIAGAPIQTVEYQEAEPSEDWIYDIVAQMAQRDPEKRKFHHLYIGAPSQAGKSTLTSKLLELLAGACATNGECVQACLIDPKYPKTRWAIKPSFIGFEQVRRGMDTACAELDRRKKLCLEAAKRGEDQPDFSRYVTILDEWDTIWGEGKGYGQVITKEDAQDIKASALRLFKESAAYNFHFILIGQSPLSTDNGFTQSSLNSACRLILNTEASRFLNNTAFPFPAYKDGLESAIAQLGSKYPRICLVVPNSGEPFVAAIPRLQIGQVQADTPPQPPTPESLGDWQSELSEWVRLAPTRPTPDQLAAKFKQLTGKDADGNKLYEFLA